MCKSKRLLSPWTFSNGSQVVQVNLQAREEIPLRLYDEPINLAAETDESAVVEQVQLQVQKWSYVG